MDKSELEKNMRLALHQAELAGACGEVPVGAVVTLGERLVSVGCNRRETDRNALMHAEIAAIDAACRTLGTWRLSDCTLYVTLEPCPMCTGAIINARLKTVVIGARDAKAGCCGSVIDLFACPFNHRPEVLFGVLEDECAEILRAFFKGLRERRQSGD